MMKTILTILLAIAALTFMAVAQGRDRTAEAHEASQVLSRRGTIAMHVMPAFIQRHPQPSDPAAKARVTADSVAYADALIAELDNRPAAKSTLRSSGRLVFHIGADPSDVIISIDGKVLEGALRDQFVERANHQLADGEVLTVPVAAGDVYRGNWSAFSSDSSQRNDNFRPVPIKRGIED